MNWFTRIDYIPIAMAGGGELLLTINKRIMDKDRKQIYYVHPIVDNHVWVTKEYVNKGKAKKRIAFQIDLPGR